MSVYNFQDGMIIQADITDPAVLDYVRMCVGGRVPLIVADPPYGKIVKQSWDHEIKDQLSFAAWMISWTKAWSSLLNDGDAFYVWGGVGLPGFRPFFLFETMIEEHGFVLQPITWEKRRGYGVQDNYLFCREELAYLVKGEKPSIFHVPHTTVKRGYPGYNEKYPAKSEFMRRTTVWTETEILRDKLHDCQKADRVCEVPIEVHTEPGDVVIELFGGSGSTSAAARRLGRRWIVVERGDEEVQIIRKRMAS